MNYTYSKGLILPSHMSEIKQFKWVPCHHCMACPQVVEGGEGLQIRRVGVYILNMQSRTVQRVLSSSLGVGWGLKTHYRALVNMIMNFPDALKVQNFSIS